MTTRPQTAAAAAGGGAGALLSTVALWLLQGIGGVDLPANVAEALAALFTMATGTGTAWLRERHDKP